MTIGQENKQVARKESVFVSQTPHYLRISSPDAGKFIEAKSEAYEGGKDIVPLADVFQRHR